MEKEQTPILIVDDSSSMRHVVKNHLHELYYEKVYEAGSGEEAWEMLQKQEIQLVLLDWRMDGMTGLDLLKKIRSTKEFSQLPVIMITSEAEQQKILDAAKEGVTAYILKPFDAFTLAEKISKVL